MDQGWSLIRFAKRKETITTDYYHGKLIALIVIVIQVRVATLHITCAVAPLATVLHTFLIPKAY